MEKKNMYNFWLRLILGTIAIPIMCLMLILIMWISDQGFAKVMIETGENFLLKKKTSDIE